MDGNNYNLRALNFRILSYCKKVADIMHTSTS